jgi:hypothetical protein
MARRGPRRPPLSLEEVSEPDPAKAAEGLRLLGRMIARAYARDMALAQGNGHGDPAWVPPEEESRDDAED